MKTIKDLCQILGVEFKNKDLIRNALTHSSYANEHGGEHNERLEFLGDAVLDLCISKHLFESKHLDEGEMTKKRAQSVREEALVIYASHIDLASYLYLGNGVEQSGGRKRDAIIADAFESVLGAVFLEFGFETACDVVNRIVMPYIDEVVVLKDFKSAFQELVQADKRSVLYEIVSKTGPAHNPTFEAIVKIDDSIIMGRGFGHTKQDAQQAAAKEALDKMAK